MRFQHTLAASAGLVEVSRSSRRLRRSDRGRQRRMMLDATPGVAVLPAVAHIWAFGLTIRLGGLHRTQRCVSRPIHLKHFCKGTVRIISDLSQYHWMFGSRGGLVHSRTEFTLSSRQKGRRLSGLAIGGRRRMTL